MFPPYGETNGAPYHSHSAFPCIYAFEIYKGSIRSRGRSGACNQVYGERLQIPACQLGMRLCGEKKRRPRPLRSNLRRLALGAEDTCYGGLADSIPGYKWLAAAPLKSVKYVEDGGCKDGIFFNEMLRRWRALFFFFQQEKRTFYRRNVIFLQCSGGFFVLQDVNNFPSMLSANMDRG